MQLFVNRARRGSPPEFALTDGQRRHRRRHLPPPRRHPTRHRACRRPRRGAVGGADPQPPRRSLPAADRRQPHRTPSPSDPAGGVRWTGPFAQLSHASRRSCAASRSSSAAVASTPPTRVATRGDEHRDPSICSSHWSISRWCRWMTRRRGRVSHATRCSRRSASTAGDRSSSIAEASAARHRHPRRVLALSETLRPRIHVRPAA